MRQLSVLLSSGIPISTSLSLAAQQTENETIRRALYTVNHDIEHGQSLSTAVARFPVIFDNVTVSMIRSGEASGQLQQVLEELAKRLEEAVNFNAKVRNALLYPVFIIAVLIIVVGLMSTLVIPRLAEVFQESDLKLPWTTQLLITITSFTSRYWYLLAALLVAGIVALRPFFVMAEGRQIIYTLQMRIPLFKKLVMNSMLVRFTSLLQMLIHSGVPITQALDITGSAMQNLQWERAIRIAQTEVERGIPLSTALARHSVFPKQLTQMIAVGEETGKIDTIFDTARQYYEQETDVLVKGITALLEPIILLVVAVGIGFVVISIIVPIYSLAEQF